MARVSAVWGRPARSGGERPDAADAGWGRGAAHTDVRGLSTRGDGTFPPDEELGLLPGSVTPRPQASLVRLGGWMPFAHAARELGWLTRAAGGTVLARDLSYLSRRAEHTAFRRLALVETYRRGVGTARVAVAVMDGADWLQRCIDVHRPDAIRVLDVPHAIEDLTHASHEAHGAGTARTSEWIATQAHAHNRDGPDPALAALRALPAGDRRDTALGYLEPRLRQLRNPTFRAAGYPIRSGIVERANKVVVEDRLEGSGRHGAPRSVDPMLALRTVVCADRWEEARPQIGARLRAADRARRQQRRQRATDRRAARDAAAQSDQVPATTTAPDMAAPALGTTPPTTPMPPPIPTTVVNGRPTKAHPRRRRFLQHRPPSPAEN